MNQTSPQLAVVVTRTSAPTASFLQDRSGIWVARLCEHISNAILLGQLKTPLGRTNRATEAKPATATTSL